MFRTFKTYIYAVIVLHLGNISMRVQSAVALYCCKTSFECCGMRTLNYKKYKNYSLSVLYVNLSSTVARCVILGGNI